MDPDRTPNPFDDVYTALATARALITATRLGVFSSLHTRPASAAELANQLGLNAVGTEALLVTLEALSYIECDDRGAYRPTAAGLRLVPGTPKSVAHFIGDYSAHAWELWGELDEVLLGKRHADEHEREPGDPFWDGYLRGLFELGAWMDEEARTLPLDGLSPRTMLDIAGGHGALAMAMCRVHPDLHVTVLDLPASARVGREIIAEQGFSDRVTVQEGDALEDPLGSDYDIVSAYNFIHHLSAEALPGLFSRVHAALADDGWFLISDDEPPKPGQAASLSGALSGLMYFVHSEAANHRHEYVIDCLHEAGFSDVRIRRDDEPLNLLYLARR